MLNRKVTRLLLAVALAIPAVLHAAESQNYDFVINAMPASLLIDTEGTKFSVTGVDGTTTKMSEVFTMPNIAAGVGTYLGNFYVDVVGGGGVLINDSFRSFMLQAIAEGGYQVSESLVIGPRVGYVYFPDPTWLDSSDVNFNSDGGLLAGVQIVMGDKIKYAVSVDFLDASFGMDQPSAGVSTSKDKFDLTALAIQFGVRGEF